MKLPCGVAALSVVLLSAQPARADLIVRNGMVYDTVEDLTWLQDVTYARTSGYETPYFNTTLPDAAGLFHSPESAAAWAAQLSFGGFDDWRLPAWQGGLWQDARSEINTLVAQFGWHQPNPHDYDMVHGTGGPFLHWDGNAVWLASGWIRWNPIYGVDYAEDGSRAMAWAVRDGAPVGVPEPPPLLLVVVGAALWLRMRRIRKATIVGPIVVVIMLAMPSTARADLIDLGNGTIYSTDLGYAFLRDMSTPLTTGYAPNGLTWLESLDWIAHLNAVGHLGYTDWQLAGGSGENFVPNSFLLQRLFYEELDNPRHQVGTPFNSGPFLNVATTYGAGFYWVATEAWGQTVDECRAGQPCHVSMYNPRTDYYEGWPDQYRFNATAMRQVNVPEPSTFVLLTVGLGLAWRTRVTTRGRAIP